MNSDIAVYEVWTKWVKWRKTGQFGVHGGNRTIFETMVADIRGRLGFENVQVVCVRLGAHG